MRIWPIFILSVSADICHDFCVEQLGLSACSTAASYCIDEKTCHGLFWTSAEKAFVCVFTEEHGECTARFPVLCSEATTRLSGTSETTSATPETTHQTSSSLPPIYTTLLESSSLSLAALRERDNVHALKIYFQSAYTHRIPYVKVSFEKEGRNLGYYGVFDISAYTSYAIVENETFVSQVWTRDPPGYFYTEPYQRLVTDQRELITRESQIFEGYQISQDFALPRDPRSEQRGRESYEVLCSVPERISIFSGPSKPFSFNDPAFKLLRPPGSNFRLAIGASFISPFATAAGVFAIVPAPLHVENPALDWQLLIGRQNLSAHPQMYCETSRQIMRWYNLARPSPSTWAIPGYMWLGNSNNDIPRNTGQNVSIMLSSVWLEGPMVGQRIMQEVIAKIESLGPRLVVTDNKTTIPSHPLFTNCTRRTNFLTMMQLGLKPVPKEDYGDDTVISHRINLIQDMVFDQTKALCRLKWEILPNIQHQNSILVGPSFLKNFVTVFDRDNTQIGLCKRGNTTIIH